jgi:arylsulfatase
MPHLPVHASDEFKGKSKRGLYGDCMEDIDAMLGTLISTLEAEGIAKNTLDIFTSDNGPWIRFENTANDEFYGEARLLIGSALPFRDGKGSTWEGGVRVVGAWYWPGVIAPGTVVRTPASAMDVLPTAFALAGEPLPTDRTLDGRDIRPFLNANKFPGEVRAFEHIYTGNNGNAIFAARKGPWKLHIGLYSQTGSNHGFTASPERPLLFNVEEDPSERIDRSAEEPTSVAELQRIISAFRSSLDTEQTFWGAP